jgi:hypothetical protein
VLLTDVLIQIGRTQTRGQWLGNRCTAKQIHHVALKPLFESVADHAFDFVGVSLLAIRFVSHNCIV